MSVRSALTRLAIVTAAGALAATATVTPALADEWDPDGGGSFNSQGQRDDPDDWQNQGGQNQGGQNQGGGGQNQGGGGQNQGGQNQGGGGGGQNNGQGNGQGNGQNNGQGNGQGNGQNNGQGNGQGNGQNNGQGNGQNNGQGNGQNGNSQNGNGQNGNWQSGGGSDWQSGGSGEWQSGGDGGDWQSGDQDDSRRFRGRVTANELLLRSRPDRGGQVIRVARRGEIVSIFCRTTGENIQGNSQWYLLTDGTWAWGAARYIDTIGTTPRWC
ncbi:SH3 domain-containing protein [Streptomyces sp. yr375]|uniref:SH3 domain-containing protein n=1 Tax=Streptomyces sp. yr375 TaxID=1761906 RepID=UPI0008D57EE4|nr:SH3 domain-containing protein [Streptomyces sp. yr375]SER29322.1 SH3 domain-containing protein [Streptomyces sp. yr375]